MLREIIVTKELIEVLHLGIKEKKTDGVCIKLPDMSTLGMISTKNKFPAIPVIINKQKHPSTRVKYLFINSGNANACTGSVGMMNAKDYVLALSKKFGCVSENILIFSTGIIGQQLPIKRVINSINKCDFKFKSSLKSASKAIMTTDKYEKWVVRKFKISGIDIEIRGICKGAGMIEPNMATMLAFIFVDIKMTKKIISKILHNCAAESFNKISVDGDMSTNDSVALVATGLNSIDLTNKKHYQHVEQNIKSVFRQLAHMIVSDGEGATKVCKLSVTKAYSFIQANQVCYSIANSNLFKTALFGEDPNWGRIIARLGSLNKIRYNSNDVVLKINGITVFKKGIPTNQSNSKKLVNSMKNSNIDVEICLNSGSYNANILTSDLSKKYVQINSKYST